MMDQRANLLPARTQRTNQSRAQVSGSTGHNDDSHSPPTPPSSAPQHSCTMWSHVGAQRPGLGEPQPVGTHYT